MKTQEIILSIFFSFCLGFGLGYGICRKLLRSICLFSVGEHKTKHIFGEPCDGSEKD